MSRTQALRRYVQILGIVALASSVGSAWSADVEELVEGCADCHGKGGASPHSDVPIIGGFSAIYTTDSMIAYKEEERPCPKIEYKSGKNKGKQTTMCEIADEFDEDELEKIGEYYAAKPFVRAKQDFDAALAKKGEEIHKESCKKCHAEGGSLPDDDSGILAGQWTAYLKQAFDEYSSGERPMVKKMKPKYEALEAADLEALLHYYASFQ